MHAEFCHYEVLWFQIPGTEFSVCVVLDETETYRQFADPAHFPARVLYHRTDLTDNPPPRCNDFNRAVYAGECNRQRQANTGGCRFVRIC